MIPGIFEPDTDWRLLDESLRGGMKRYVEEHIIPGGFLTACLENNLHEAVMRADANNLIRLADTMRFIWNYIPGSCWGSREAVEKWAAERITA